MNYKDAIQILGLHSLRSSIELKNAFRRYALQHHPDRNPNKSDEAFRQGVQAYEFLIAHPGEWRPISEPPEDFEDIFEDLFGFTSQDRILGYRPSEAISLDIFELICGAEKTVRLSAYKPCEPCGGNGALGRVRVCTYCFGCGKIEREGESKVCPRCGGRGRAIQERCLSCDGYGRKKIFSRQRLTIPKGLKPDGLFTLHSVDLASNQVLDVFLKVQLKPHPVFTVENSDILCDYPISQSVADMGGVVRVPGPLGWSELVVPPEQKTGLVLRVAGLGLQGSGDLVLRLMVVSDKRIRRIFRNFTEKAIYGNPRYGERRSRWKKFIDWFQF